MVQGVSNGHSHAAQLQASQQAAQHQRAAKAAEVRDNERSEAPDGDEGGSGRHVDVYA